MKCIVESAGSVASSVRIGSHELLFDQPLSVAGGADSGPSPLDVMVASVGACAHYFAAAFLLARKIPPEGLRVVALAEKARETSLRISKLQLYVTLPDAVPSHFLPAIERAIRACPAYNTLVDPPLVSIELSQDGAQGNSPLATAAFRPVTNSTKALSDFPQHEQCRPSHS